MANNYDGLYKNFVFMAGWRDMLEGMAEDFGLEYAKEALWDLMLAGTFDPNKQEGEQELLSTKKSIIGFVQGCIAPVVKSSTNNYDRNQKNGSKGGRPKIEVNVEEAIRLHDEEKKTWKEIAISFGINADTLRKAREEYEQEKLKNRKTESEKLETEKPENPEFSVFPTNNPENRKTEKPENPYEINGFRF